MLNYWRYFLFPLSVIYAIGVIARRLAYKYKILKPVIHPHLYIISVGNLRIGGTGKTPFIDYLCQHLKQQYPIALASRGYNRINKNDALYTPFDNKKNLSVDDLGDEMFLLYVKHNDVVCAVNSNKNEALKNIQNQTKAKIILLDDAFQSLYIDINYHILLTDFYNLFTNDFILPMGNLRDCKNQYKKAHIIIVSKCPKHLSDKQKETIINTINPLLHQQVFFTSIDYLHPQHLFNNQIYTNKNTPIIVLHAIAQPKYFKDDLQNQFLIIDELAYADHHNFTTQNIHQLVSIYSRHKNQYPNVIIITTTKDAVKLKRFKNILSHLPIYYIDIKVNVLFNQETQLLKCITKTINL